MLLHGTGGDENDLLPLGQMLAGDAKNIAFLSPRGRVLENGTPRFFRRLAGALYPSFGLLLRPEWAALAMSASTVTVKLNALLLNRGRFSTS